MEDLSTLTKQLREYENRHEDRSSATFEASWNKSEKLETIFSARGSEIDETDIPVAEPHRRRQRQKDSGEYGRLTEDALKSLGRPRRRAQATGKVRRPISRASSIDSILDADKLPKPAPKLRHKPGDFTVGGVKNEYRRRARAQEALLRGRPEAQLAAAAARRRVKEQRKAVRRRQREEVQREEEARAARFHHLGADFSLTGGAPSQIWEHSGGVGAARVAAPSPPPPPPPPSVGVADCLLVPGVCVRRHVMDDYTRFCLLKDAKKALKACQPVVLQILNPDLPKAKTIAELWQQQDETCLSEAHSQVQPPIKTDEAPLADNDHDPAACSLALRSLYMGAAHLCREPCAPPPAFHAALGAWEVLLEPHERYARFRAAAEEEEAAAAGRRRRKRDGAAGGGEDDGPPPRPDEGGRVTGGAERALPLAMAGAAGVEGGRPGLGPGPLRSASAAAAPCDRRGAGLGITEKLGCKEAEAQRCGAAARSVTVPCLLGEQAVGLFSDSNEDALSPLPLRMPQSSTRSPFKNEKSPNLLEPFLLPPLSTTDQNGRQQREKGAEVCGGGGGGEVILSSSSCHHGLGNYLPMASQRDDSNKQQQSKKGGNKKRPENKSKQDCGDAAEPAATLLSRKGAEQNTKQINSSRLPILKPSSRLPGINFPSSPVYIQGGGGGSEALLVRAPSPIQALP